MRDIKRGAERFAAGDFAHEIHVSAPDEIGEVAVGLNAMGRQLERDDPDHHRGAQRTRGRAGRHDRGRAGRRRAGTRHHDQRRGGPPARRRARRRPRVAASRRSCATPSCRSFVAAVLAGEEPVEGDVIMHADQDARELRVHGAQLAKRQPATATVAAARRRAERHHAHAALRGHQARLRGQRLARDQDAGHDDQGLRRDPPRRRPRRSRRRRAVPAHHRRSGRPPERHHRRPSEPLEPRERLRRRRDLAGARQHPRRPAGGPRRLRDEGGRKAHHAVARPAPRISSPRSTRRCSSRRS